MRPEERGKLEAATGRLGLAAVQLRKAGELVQEWEALREGQGRGHISGAVDMLIGGLEQAVASLSDHLTYLAEGEYVAAPTARKRET